MEEGLLLRMAGGDLLVSRKERKTKMIREKTKVA